MPKTNIAYGKSYKPCPCAQINDYVTTNNTYFSCNCYSPKRGGKHPKITDVAQTRICMGGVSGGKRYTACPYYVKGAQVKVPKRRVKNSSKRLTEHIIGFLICIWIASVCLKSGAQYSVLFGGMFALGGIMFLITLFTKNSKIDDE